MYRDEFIVGQSLALMMIVMRLGYRVGYPLRMAKRPANTDFTHAAILHHMHTYLPRLTITIENSAAAFTPKKKKKKFQY